MEFNLMDGSDNLGAVIEWWELFNKALPRVSGNPPLYVSTQVHNLHVFVRGAGTTKPGGEGDFKVAYFLDPETVRVLGVFLFDDVYGIVEISPDLSNHFWVGAIAPDATEATDVCGGV